MHALWNILTPYNLMLLFIGVSLGLILGALPGVGGLTGMTIMLPFIMDMLPESSMVLLVGLVAVVATGDLIPAILIGVPGGVGSQATVLDGFAMAKKGEAGRAFGAAYMSSLMGGIIGALFLTLTLPILKPLVGSLGSPEFLMAGVLGLSMISSLSSDSPLIGAALALCGVMLTMVGLDPQTGFYKWTLGGQAYLLDGLPLIPIVMGLFAIPETMELVGKGKAIAQQGSAMQIGSDYMEGIKDTFRNWGLVVRSSILGVVVGLIPGLGTPVVDWLAYAQAKMTAKDSSQFGKGDVRGVIAPESANNAKDGGALIPTIAFGIPGSLTMVIIISALTMGGIIPGPDMLGKHLNVTFTMIWTLVIANILACGLCFWLTRPIAKLSFVRVGLIAPFIIVLIFFSSTQATSHIADVLITLIFALIGWALKEAKWPRPPLVLGLVLGPLVGQYLFLSVQLYQTRWLTFPGVIGLGALSLFTIAYSTWKSQKQKRSAQGVAA